MQIKWFFLENSFFKSFWLTFSFSPLIGADQVHNLEASNHRLETLIQRELHRKCPGEVKHLDKYLRTVSVLQQQVCGRTVSWLVDAISFRTGPNRHASGNDAVMS